MYLCHLCLFVPFPSSRSTSHPPCSPYPPSPKHHPAVSPLPSPSPKHIIQPFSSHYLHNQPHPVFWCSSSRTFRARRLPTAFFAYCIRTYRICAPSVPAALAIVPYTYPLVCLPHQHHCLYKSTSKFLPDPHKARIMRFTACGINSSSNGRLRLLCLASSTLLLP